MRRIWKAVKEHSFKWVILLWMVFVGIASRESLHNYTQEMRNSHYDMTLLDMSLPLILLISLVCGIIQLIKKKYFIGVALLLISVWCIYIRMDISGLSCTMCTMGG